MMALPRGGYRLWRPFLFALEAERAHQSILWALENLPLPLGDPGFDPILESSHWGLNFPSPLGLAPGFDKDARVMKAMLKLGFGYVEVGTLTPRPQVGNPRPRLFRLKADSAVINRMGFNNQGMEAAAGRLSRWRAGHDKGLVGVNIGKNKDSEDAASDYRMAASALGTYADYITINVSSPNTPGLRALQSKDALEEIIAEVSAALPINHRGVKPPILLKIAPDLTDADKSDIAETARGGRLSALIISNTTVDRPSSLQDQAAGEAGGLSGRPLMLPSTKLVAEFYRELGKTLPLIGVGGIESGETAYEKIRAGASLLQIYSGLVYGGPALVASINRELASLLRRDGFNQLSEAIGSAA